MPVEIGYVPTLHSRSAHGVVVPDDLPASTTDVLIAAPRTVSVLYAALTVERRSDEADQLVAAHHAGVGAAVGELNRRASSAVVYRGARHYTPQSRLAEMLEREPDSIPERHDELARQARTELRDPTLVERVESTGLRINQLFHDSHDQGRGDPHLHTHLFVDPQVVARDDGHEYARDPFIDRSVIEQAMQMYDTRLSQELAVKLGARSWLNDRTGRREIDGISDDAVASFRGVRCVPDLRLEQLVTAEFVGYSL